MGDGRSDEELFQRVRARLRAQVGEDIFTLVVRASRARGDRRGPGASERPTRFLCLPDTVQLLRQDLWMCSRPRYPVWRASPDVCASTARRGPAWRKHPSDPWPSGAERTDAAAEPAAARYQLRAQGRCTGRLGARSRNDVRELRAGREQRDRAGHRQTGRTRPSTAPSASIRSTSIRASASANRICSTPSPGPPVPASPDATSSTSPPITSCTTSSQRCSVSRRSPSRSDCAASICS